MSVSPLFVSILRENHTVFCYETDDEVAHVFSEQLEVPTTTILFELAQVFPQYKFILKEAKLRWLRLTLMKMC